jgi:nucleotide-binding universal stress UspA family protein
MKIQHILAGIDFEKQTGRILAYASLFAQNFQASLHLLHVIDYLVTPPAYLDQYIEKEKSSAEEKLATIQRELAGSGIGVHSTVLVGRLQASFETALQKTGADLLVLGFASHGFRRSSSEKLIKGLQMPMLVVRGKKSETASAGNISIRRILCPVDFSDSSKQALGISRELARTFSSEIEVMHVLQESAMKKIKVRGAKKEAMRKIYEREKSRLEDVLTASSFDSRGIMEQGEPYKRIVSFAKEEDIDLIVMGARGLGFIKGMLIGSVTDAVLKSAPCPVFVIH